MKQGRKSTLMAGACLVLCLSACGDGEWVSSSIDTLSFFDGGTYGHVTFKGVTLSDRTPGLPYLGAYADYFTTKTVTPEDIPYNTYGGVRRLPRGSYEFLGHTVLDRENTLRFQIFARLSNGMGIDFAQPQSIYVGGASLESNTFWCVQAGEDGVLRTVPASSSLNECMNYPLLRDHLFDSEEDGVQIDLDLGSFQSSGKSLKFALLTNREGKPLPVTYIDSGFASTYLNAHANSVVLFEPGGMRRIPWK